MELKVESLEKKLDEIVRLLRGQHRAKGVQHSPTFHRESHGSWDHHQEERYSPHSQGSPLHY